jgi:class 3 adenylate cyclase/predicted ATPase
MSGGTGTDIQDWLAEIGLEKYADVFARHEITVGVLAHLTEPDIDRLALPTGPRRQLIDAIRALGDANRGKPTVLAPDPSLAPPVRTQGAERSHITVMFCDLVGSTELSERLDPEELRVLVTCFREESGKVVVRYGGQVAQYVGDGLMAYFGWPTASENNAESSVRAALEIVGAVKVVRADPPLRVRIGVATGTVVVGPLSLGNDSEARLAIGETPNLAKRLQELAAPDTVVIAPHTRKLVGNTFDLTDIGTHLVKGIDGPVSAWRVLCVGDAPSRFEARRSRQLTPLIGRAEEIGLLLDRRQIASEGKGRAVLLSGEAGIGKSRVLSEFRERIEAQDVQTLRFQCSPYHVNHALWPSIDSFERTLKYERNELAKTKLEKLEGLFVGEFGRPLSDVRFIASLLSIPCDERHGSLAITPQKRKDETIRTLVEFAEAAARKRSTVVLFEDMQWADATTLEVLDLLVERVNRLPLLMVLTHRPDFQNRWAGNDHVEALNLTKLTRSQSGVMVSRLAENKALPGDLVQQILTKTEGVPLFVEELTMSILESGQLNDAGDRYEYVGPSRVISVPETLSDSLMARLDRDKAVKEIAQIGAAIGREFSYDLISAVAIRSTNKTDSRSRADVQDMLKRLTESGLAFRRGAIPAATFTFKHALVQDAAYGSLLKSDRRKLHTKIAQQIEENFSNIKNNEPEVLAHHYTRAGMFEQGAAYWIKAGQSAIGRRALREALAHLGAAYAMGESGEAEERRNGDTKDEGEKRTGLGVVKLLPASEARDRLELDCRVALSTALEALEGWASPKLPKVLEPARPLAISTRHPKHLARTLWGLWVQLMSIGPVAESLVWAEELLNAGREFDDEELDLVGHMAVMVTNFWLGNPRDVEAHADAILDLYNRERHGHIVDTMNHDPRTLAGIYLSQALWILGYPDQAEAIVDERDAHAREIDHPFDYGFALTLGAWVFHYRREPDKQLARIEALQKLAQDAGLPFLSGVLAPYLSTGLGLAQQGRLSEGIEHMQEGIRGWEVAGAKTVTPYIRARLGEALALSGDIDAGLAHVDEMLEQIARPGWQERSFLAEILRLKGWMLSLKGDLAGAERNYLASLAWAREQQAKSWELRTATSLARLWQAQGKGKDARDLLAPIYGWFTEGFDTKDLIEAKALLAELAE